MLQRREREADRSLLGDLRLVAVADRGAVDHRDLPGEDAGGQQQCRDERCFGPTSTTWRRAAGLSAVGAAPAPWEVVVLSAMTFPPGKPLCFPSDLLIHNSPNRNRAQGNR